MRAFSHCWRVAHTCRRFGAGMRLSRASRERNQRGRAGFARQFPRRRTAKAGCRSEHSRSEWAEGRAADAASQSILILVCSRSFVAASVRFSARVRRAGYFLLLAQEKVAKENAPRMPRCLRQCARPGRGSLNAHPCTCNELARIVRAILRTFPACPRRGKRGPEDQEQERSLPPSAPSPASGGRDSSGFPSLFLSFALDLPPPSPHRASQAGAGERRACPSAGMREFAPARRRREAQGTSRA